MSFSDNIAIVALVISLLALGTASLQLTQQVFAAVEGYRRCAPSIIGPWHKLRRLRWKFWEFRFEARFVAPKIVLLAGVGVRQSSQLHAGCYVIGQGLEKKESRELDLTLHGEHCSEVVPVKLVVPGFQRDAPLLHAGTWSTEQSGQAGRRRVNEDAEGGNRKLAPEHDSEKHTRLTGSGNSVRHPHYGFWLRRYPPKLEDGTKKGLQIGNTHMPEIEVLASWLVLLRQLHSLYVGYWPHECSKDCNVARSGIEPAQNQETSCDARELYLDNYVRTIPTAINCSWSFDFLPSGLTRPLARIDVGDVVILALRLGMTWRGLDPANGSMAAEGNGYSLTANEFPGLGLVLRFNSGQDCGYFPAIIPSRAADKLMCGIIPGCPNLVRRDFYLIEDRNSRRDPASILTYLGVPWSARKSIMQHDYRETNNELITLLCPFLPLQNSHMVLHLFNGWLEGMLSVFQCWEGRVCLHRGAERAKARFASTPQLDTLSEIAGKLDKFRDTFADDYYVRHGRRAMPGHQGAERQTALLSFLRETFNYTTQYFQKREYGWDEVDAEGRTRYMDLVAAHVCMTDECVTSALSKPKGRPDIAALSKKYGVEKAEDRGDWISQEVFEKGHAYVHAVENAKEHGGFDFILERHKSLSREQVEEAYWVLLLRGIVWSASTSLITTSNPVSANFYDDKTPLWIT